MSLEHPLAKLLVSIPVAMLLLSAGARAEDAASSGTGGNWSLSRDRGGPDGATGGGDGYVPGTPKPPEAITATVIGGYLADHLAQGLRDAYARQPLLVIDNQAVRGTGLAIQRDTPWPQRAATILAADRTDVIIVMIGSNDRRHMWEPRKHFTLGSEEWADEYRKRIKALVDILVRSGKPILWVSLPPVSTRKASDYNTQFNGLYKEVVEKAGGTFVDIWDRFTREDGRYAAYGPALDGRNRLLRANDGVGFSAAGRRKLAFYLEKHLNKAIKDGESTLFSGTARVRRRKGAGLMGVPVSLSDPVARAGEALLGGRSSRRKALRPNEKLPAYRLFVLGERIASIPGRADDFSWPRRVVRHEPRPAPAPAVAAPVLGGRSR